MSTQPGHPFVGRCNELSTSQRAVMPCGWGVKVGMVRVWVADKTVWSPSYTQAISERFTDKELTRSLRIYKVLYKFAFFYFFKNKSETEKAADNRCKTEVYIKSDISFRATTEQIQQWQTKDPHLSSNPRQTELIIIIICKKLSILPQHHNFRHVGSTGQVMLSLSTIIREKLQKPYPVNLRIYLQAIVSFSSVWFIFCLVPRDITWVSKQSLTSYMTHYTSFRRPDSLGPRVHMLVTYQFIRVHLAFCTITHHINKQHCNRCIPHCYMLLQLGKLFFSTDMVQQLTRTWDNISSDTLTSVVLWIKNHLGNKQVLCRYQSSAVEPIACFIAFIP